MPIRNLNVSEARRDLPRLVRQAARGASVGIGPRGKSAAVLIGADEFEGLRRRAQAPQGSSGWERLRLELDGTIDELDADLRAIRAEAELPAARPASRGASPRHRT